MTPDLDSYPSLSLADSALDARITPPTPEEIRRAQIACAVHSIDRDDLELLLDVLDLGTRP